MSRTTAGSSKKKASFKSPEPTYPAPFDKASTSIQSFLPQLDPAKIYITHIDRHKPEYKKQIFFFAVLVNSSVTALLLWRIFNAAPKYFALLQTFLGFASTATVDTARTTRQEQIWIVVRRTAMMVFDYLLLSFIGPWPLTFFFERPANPMTWRWNIRFQSEELIARVSRNWSSEDLLKGAKKGEESPFFKTRIVPATEPDFMEKTGYLMMGGSWDLDFDLMQDAHILVRQDKLKMVDLDRLVLAHQEGLGWMAWKFGSEEANHVDVGLELRKAMEGMGNTNSVR